MREAGAASECTRVEGSARMNSCQTPRDGTEILSLEPQSCGRRGSWKFLLDSWSSCSGFASPTALFTKPPFSQGYLPLLPRNSSFCSVFDLFITSFSGNTWSGNSFLPTLFNDSYFPYAASLLHFLDILQILFWDKTYLWWSLNSCVAISDFIRIKEHLL